MVFGGAARPTPSLSDSAVRNPWVQFRRVGVAGDRRGLSQVGAAERLANASDRDDLPTANGEVVLVVRVGVGNNNYIRLNL